MVRPRSGGSAPFAHHPVGKILPGAEAAPGAGQEHGAAGCVGLGFGERGAKRKMHRLVEGVEPRRPVERDDAIALLALDQDRCLVHASPSSSAFRHFGAAGRCQACAADDFHVGAGSCQRRRVVDCQREEAACGAAIRHDIENDGQDAHDPRSSRSRRRRKRSRGSIGCIARRRARCARPGALLRDARAARPPMSAPASAIPRSG